MSDQQGGMENMEALFKGQKGQKGDKGEKGEKGSSRLPALLAWSLVVLFVVAVAVGGTAYFSSVTARRTADHAIQAAQVEQRRSALAEQAAQRRAGQVIEQKLCSTLGHLAQLKPPAGNPKTNPSRAYEQALYATLSRLGPDLGCPPAQLSALIRNRSGKDQDETTTAG